MVTLLYVIFFVAVFAPLYTYAIYPLILKALPARSYVTDNNAVPLVSVLVAAYNEECVIADKIKNMSELDYPAERIEFLIGSDGSSDRTVEIARSCSTMPNLKVFDLPRGGKVQALNALLREAGGDILVFTDANTLLDRQAIRKLVSRFGDQAIGLVSGLLHYSVDENSGQGAQSLGTYWKYENWVKMQESKLGRLSGANGGLYAMRRGIVPEIPPGIVNDDFYMANYTLQAGWDVVMAEEAVAYEKPNDAMSSQFKRHVRDGAGHYQAMAVFWRMLLPRKGSFSYVSHRVVKWLVPFMLIAAFFSNLVLSFFSPVMLVVFWLQVLGYGVLLLNWFINRRGGRLPGIVGKLIQMACYFIAVNIALLVGFFKYLGGKQSSTWETQRA
ncbi:Beta-monoglucosyldiacylglycerol synthase [Sporotomaculum syntrophicum]|uniref:Beta-monoglucosyldiacylglycerol synthase n=1 Tax=Sporotomaculum syntrophicum TaxID=182264 RepID=A0A9D2WS28_9FIRM|nr:glycosyltransferase family 2 protein [Sporotomaculum syntrophicum]KAF1086090.1 Beta-monoglucosyldiacylglycerol synthase [Sporotomaculum syntrophicum]